MIEQNENITHYNTSPGSTKSRLSRLMQDKTYELFIMRNKVVCNKNSVSKLVLTVYDKP